MNNYSSNKELENLSETFMQFKVASKMILFLLLSNRGSSYKRMSFLSMSEKDLSVDRYVRSFIL